MTANFGEWGAPITSEQAAANAMLQGKLQKLAEWQDKKNELARVQEEERQLRAEIIALFSNQKDAMAEGTENVPTVQGTIKIKHSLNYKLGNPDLVDRALDEIEKSQEGGNVIAERLVKWEPKLLVSEYRLLNEAQKKMIDKVLTITPSAKSVEFEPPRGA